LKQMRENIVINTIVFKDLIDTGVKQWETFELVKSLGVSNIEIRREWIVDFQREIEIMALEAERQTIELLYSVPISLFSEKHLNKNNVLTCLDEAERMKMKMVKFTIGDFDAANLDAIRELKAILRNRNMMVTVENDQTMQSGKLKVLKDFLACCKEHGVPMYCTYDIGNWCWVNENPVNNALNLAEYVRYIHLKDVSYENDKPVAQFLGKGIVDWQTILKLLPQNVPLGIEYPCGPEPLEVLKDAINKLINSN
jgi:sugar phosphate isomerase/epimerase